MCTDFTALAQTIAGLTRGKIAAKPDEIGKRPFLPNADGTPMNGLPKSCDGDGDVVGVVTPLRGVAQVVLHGVQVVEVGVRLKVHQDRGVEEDGEGQVEVEREEGEVREKRSCMKMG